MVSASSSRRGTSSILLKITSGFVLLIVLCIGVLALLNSYNYSDGIRTGVVTKLSKKGILCWTTEGNLAQITFSRSGELGVGKEVTDNTFYFSVPDPVIQKELQAIPAGIPVTLNYHQKLCALNLPIPFFCVRRTQYEIVGVTPAPDYAPGQIPSKPAVKP